MGMITRDILTFIGILPMPRPERVEQTHKFNGDDIAYAYLEEMPEIDKEIRNFLDLFSLNGSNVYVNDRREGNYEGILLYNAFDNKYLLKTSDGIIRFKVKNLEKATGKEFLN
jgi:hypothetical protein